MDYFIFEYSDGTNETYGSTRGGSKQAPWTVPAGEWMGHSGSAHLPSYCSAVLLRWDLCLSCQWSLLQP